MIQPTHSQCRIIKTFEVNVLAHFWTIKVLLSKDDMYDPYIQAFLPDMIKNKSGHVVTIASLAGHAGTNKLVINLFLLNFTTIRLTTAPANSLQLVLMRLSVLRWLFRWRCVRVMVLSSGTRLHQDHSDLPLLHLHRDVCRSLREAAFQNLYPTFNLQSKIIPILEPEFVADSAVAGMLANREIVLLPWWSMFLLILKNLVPSPAFMKLATAFGFNCSMDQFTGREKTA